MGYKTFPAVVTAGVLGTLTTTTLTSGSSYTVPAGVTYIIATLYAGGGAAGPSGQGSNRDGIGGQYISSRITTVPATTIAYSIGTGGAGHWAAYSYAGGTNTTMTGATTAVAQNGTAVSGRVHTNAGAYISGSGGAGQIVIRYYT